VLLFTRMISYTLMFQCQIQVLPTSEIIFQNVLNLWIQVWKAKDVFWFIGRNLIFLFIFSVAGVSRSASTVIAYLMNRKEERYDKVFELVHSKRNVIMPNPSFGKQLRQYDKELIIQQQ
jgi:hypothetical protein